MTLLLGGELPRKWRAGMAWCAAPRDNAGARCFFRRSFDLDRVPATFPVLVSADSRYKLFVNGQLVGRGPLKGTLRRYHVEEYDVAPLLRPGHNVIAVDVIWFGVTLPLSEEHSGFAGFLLQGPEGAGVDTPGAWKAWHDTSFAWDLTPYTSNAHLFLAALEKVDGERLPHGWEKPDFNDSGWEPAQLAVKLSAPGGDPDYDLIWNLAPRDIPALIEEPRRFARTLEVTSAGLVPSEHRFGETPAGWKLSPGEAGEIVLDAGALTTSYPTLSFEGGQGRTVEIVYSENIWHRNPNKPDDGSPYRWGGGGRLIKGVRDDLDGGIIHGYQDTVTLPGGEFTYEPHHWRTFWFVKVRVSAGETPFTLRDFTHRFTTFPQQVRASFESSEPDVARIQEVSWRTLQLCTHETYEDCPGYEQLNYLLDARNEALTTLALTGDPSMPRRTIQLFCDTLRPDGMLSSRTPSQLRQTIPIFALWWVQMVLDYWDWVGPADGEFVRSCLYAVDGVLGYFRERLRPDGFVGELPYWNPIGGEDAPGSDLDDAIKEGGSTYVTALYLMALNAGVRLHREARNFGYPEDAARWAALMYRPKKAIESAWSSKRNVFVERLSHPDAPVSQHTQMMPLLAGAVTAARKRRLVRSLEKGVPVALMTRQQGLPFAEAMRSLGRYDLAAEQYMAEYRRQLDLHLTTWLESGEEGRSDCHAWSAWAPYAFLTSVLGIRPAAPGFREIFIAPEAVFADARGTMPTPVGDVTVSWQAKGGRITLLDVSTPAGVPTRIQLRGQEKENRVLPEGGSIRIVPEAIS